MMEGVRPLYDSTMNGLKMEELNEGIINLAVIYIMLIISIISLVIILLSLKMLVDINAKYQKLDDNMQALKILSKVTNAILGDK